MGFHVVTGAYGFTGKYITARLLAAGKEVRTLTGSPDRANLDQSQQQHPWSHLR